ncbi:hypothetical protein Leryth_017848 [Lithospermum erythrorhizon]|nr:hypothetical protein Leryth_017848 [Lithospermum erythrorhizon]
MEDIEHRIVSAYGINMHVAEKGTNGNPVILFLRGFPEFLVHMALAQHAVRVRLPGCNRTSLGAMIGISTCVYSRPDDLVKGFVSLSTQTKTS